MSTVTVCYYNCRCGAEWIKPWRSTPWFLDYSIKCKDCGRTVWPGSQRKLFYAD